MKPWILHLCILLSALNLLNAQNCIFDTIKISDWEPSYYICNLSPTLYEFKEVHHPYKTNDDVQVIASKTDTNLGNLDIKFGQKFKNLEVVELKRAGIVSISRNLFKDCNNLKLADFSDNKIEKIPENLFSHSLEIMEIALGKNKLATLPEKLFKNLSKLEVLTLHDNLIDFLAPKTFDGLENLRELYLGNNKIQTLAPNLFLNLKNLETLYLNSNKILEMPEHIFENLTNLKTLVLKKNLLTIIHADSFGTLDNLRNVDLSFNNISSVDEKFIENTSVVVLMMQHNFCTNDNVQNKMEMKKILKQCFDSYGPRGSQVGVKSAPVELKLKVEKKETECGKPLDISLRSRIVLGTQVEHGDYPWLAVLVTSDGDYQCGGTLISNFKVVTAAHCVTSSSSLTIIPPGDRKILLGAYDFYNTNETDRKIHSISKILVHPEWKFLVNSSYDADVAVLELTDEVEFTNFIRPICLMKPYTFLETVTDGIVVGYGKSEDLSKEHENIARFVRTPIHNNEHCLLSNAVIREMSSNRTFCGGYANGTGVCRGDSGSGFIVFFNGTYYLRGLVSGSIWGDKYECDVNNYAVFADLIKFYGWITSGEVDAEPTTEQKIQRLVHQLKSLTLKKSNLDYVKELISCF